MTPRLPLLVGALLATLAGAAQARQVPTLPEPSTLSMLGIAAVVGIVVWRIKRRK